MKRSTTASLALRAGEHHVLVFYLATWIFGALVLFYMHCYVFFFAGCFQAYFYIVFLYIPFPDYEVWDAGSCPI